MHVDTAMMEDLIIVLYDYHDFFDFSNHDS